MLAVDLGPVDGEIAPLNREMLQPTSEVGKYGLFRVRVRDSYAYYEYE
jgi:hypothetical protein